VRGRAAVAGVVICAATGCRGAGDAAEVPVASSASSTRATPPAVASAATSVPAALVCLSRHYAGVPTAVNGAWTLALSDGTHLPWDDGLTKTYDRRLASPDLEDTLRLPYRTGPIEEVRTVDDDPGRIRSDALFKATVGGTEQAVAARLVDVVFVGRKLKIHERARGALAAVSARLERLIEATPGLARFVTGELGGTFAWRPITHTNRLSAHAYGIAIDIVVAVSHYWDADRAREKDTGPLRWRNAIPQPIVDAFEAERFVWGGRWYHYDTMHFEYRPELFDPACRPEASRDAPAQ
jgi:hypothetical protein